MSRRQDLESHIRASYGIICEYKDLIRTSDRPEDKQRAKRLIDGQWSLIEEYVAEYRRLAGGGWPLDIIEIAAHFQSGGAQKPAPASSDSQGTAVFDQRGQHVERQINVAGDYHAGAEPGMGGVADGSGHIAGGWNRQTIRRLLSAALSDEELTTFCFDHFAEVYEDLSAGMSKGQKIQRLLDHCARHGQIDRLLALIREQNPVQYQRFRTRLA